MSTANATTWVPMIGGDVIPGYWRATAQSEDAAKAMIEERMIKRAYFSLRREWCAGGKRLKEVEND